MNSDPYDSAAWRSFGMLDADESSLFDNAMSQDPGLKRACLEMDRLAAAIAAVSAEPLMPQAGELERLQQRLGLRHFSRKAPLWLAVTGWAAAAALAGFIMMDRPGVKRNSEALTVSPLPAAPSVSAAPVSETTAHEETARLTREIEVLRRSLEEFHHRDRVMFQVLSGRSMPLVMTMLPPGESMTSAGVRTSLTAMLGDALAATNRHPVPPLTDDSVAETAVVPVTEVDPPVLITEEFLPQGPPMAMPIYDAARDSGTLVVSNLPPAAEGMIYNLWVVPDAGIRPVYLGSLPDRSAAGADSFDFNLGSTMVLPAGFLLTMDPINTPTDPTEKNTVLSGPPRAAR